MSYGLTYVAAQAPATERAAFIRRTYAHLAVAILAFAGLEGALLNLPGIENILDPLLGAGRIGWMAVLVAFMVVGWVAQSWARSDTSPGLQYLGLSLYIVAEAVIFLPLLYYVTKDSTYAGVIPTAGILTLAVFGGLTLGVFLTRQDFSFLRPILAVGSLLGLGFIVAACFFPINLGMIFCFAMVVLMSGYILYYTSNVLHHYRTDQHVAAALALFACVATLFWYILQIVMSSRSR